MRNNYWCLVVLGTQQLQGMQPLISTEGTRTGATDIENLICVDVYGDVCVVC